MMCGDANINYAVANETRTETFVSQDFAGEWQRSRPSNMHCVRIVKMVSGFYIGFVCVFFLYFIILKALLLLNGQRMGCVFASVCVYMRFSLSFL